MTKSDTRGKENVPTTALGRLQCIFSFSGICRRVDWQKVINTSEIRSAFMEIKKKEQMRIWN